MTMYRFEQIAANITSRVEPSDTELDRYVGLEHLDPESIKLRRWGSPADVIGQKLKFWKGDIIYGKRRAYQRKLAWRILTGFVRRTRWFCAPSQTFVCRNSCRFSCKAICFTSAQWKFLSVHFRQRLTGARWPCRNSPCRPWTNSAASPTCSGRRMTQSLSIKMYFRH